MRMLITGASGFVGAYFLKNSNLEMTSVSLREHSVDSLDLSDYDTVIHLAALAHQMKKVPESEYFRINRDLTYELAQKSKIQGVKHFIFFSTVKVYGEFTNENEVFSEESVCRPQDAYGKSKYEAEQLLRLLDDEHFKTAIIRIPLVYGPNVKGNLMSMVNLVNRCAILPFGNIHNKRNLVHVGHLLNYVECIIAQKKAGLFLVCDDAPISTTQLVQTIAYKLNKRRILLPVPKIFQRMVSLIFPKFGIRLFGNLCIDNCLTKERLGIDAAMTFDQGIEQMLFHQK